MGWNEGLLRLHVTNVSTGFFRLTADISLVDQED
jgi:hypothetical protein